MSDKKHALDVLGAGDGVAIGRLSSKMNTTRLRIRSFLDNIPQVFGTYIPAAGAIISHHLSTRRNPWTSQYAGRGVSDCNLNRPLMFCSLDNLLCSHIKPQRYTIDPTHIDSLDVILPAILALLCSYHNSFVIIQFHSGYALFAADSAAILASIFFLAAKIISSRLLFISAWRSALFWLHVCFPDGDGRLSSSSSFAVSFDPRLYRWIRSG